MVENLTLFIISGCYLNHFDIFTVIYLPAQKSLFTEEKHL